MSYNTSGQVNAYNQDVHNNPFIRNVVINTDRTLVSGNNLTLYFHDHISRDPCALFPVNAYVNNTLNGLGMRLITQETRCSADMFLADQELIDEIGADVDFTADAPNRIAVSNYMDARRVIDNLFARGEMAAGDRADIENFLRELEKSGRYASNRDESITEAQKEIIKSLISPYVDAIKEGEPNNSEAAKSWIKCVAKHLKMWGPDSTVKHLSIHGVEGQRCFFGLFSTEEELIYQVQQGDRKSEDFYESLFAVARIYTSMGDLEGALEQSGVKLPSQSIIEQIVLRQFDASEPVVLNSFNNHRNSQEIDVEAPVVASVGHVGVFQQATGYLYQTGSMIGSMVSRNWSWLTRRAD